MLRANFSQTAKIAPATTFAASLFTSNLILRQCLLKKRQLLDFMKNPYHTNRDLFRH
jgi:hypothetical protein